MVIKDLRDHQDKKVQMENQVFKDHKGHKDL